MSDSPPPIPHQPNRKPIWSQVSLVWLIPIAALLIALAVAWQSYQNQGPLITIEFEEGTGIAPRETELRYRDIAVGLVEDVRFSEGLEKVVVSIRLDKEVAPYVDNASKFWVVRPELTARGVSGLDTVLSGVFIEGTWDNTPGGLVREFAGLPDEPLFRERENALEIALRTTANGKFTDNSPILFRGIEVGRIGKARISPEGNYAIAEAVIEEQYAHLITDTTRFWDTSGFNVSLGPTGAEIDFSSLASLVSGGITFSTFVSGGGPTQNGTVFQVFTDETAARESLFNAAEVETLELSVVFDDNVSGLAVGAPVELSGLKIGEVQTLNGIIDQNRFGDARVHLNAVVSIQPARLGLDGEVSPETALTFLTARVSQGLRARLASASLLTGGLKIELVDVEDAPPEAIALDSDIPLMPTTRSQISDASATVEGMFTRINNLPVEELLTSAIDFLDSASSFVASDGLQTVPAEVQALLGDVRGLVSSPELQNVPTLLNATLMRFENILKEIETQETVAKMVGAVEAAANAAAGVDTAIAGVPALITQFEAVAAKAADLPVDSLVTELAALAETAKTVIGTDDFEALPGQLGAALAEIDATLKTLREGGLVENANATLASARNAADSVATSVEDLPELMAQMTALLNQASRTVKGFDTGRELSRDAQDAMRDIRDAADAVSSLARKLERDPSALIRRR